MAKTQKHKKTNINYPDKTNFLTWRNGVDSSVAMKYVSPKCPKRFGVKADNTPILRPWCTIIIRLCNPRRECQRWNVRTSKMKWPVIAGLIQAKGAITPDNRSTFSSILEIRIKRSRDKGSVRKTYVEIGPRNMKKMRLTIC
jgi:hypothetical protein